MTSESELRFRATTRVHSRRFDGELVVLDLGAGKYFSLDEVGAEIWERLNGGMTLAEVVRDLANVYDVDRETLAGDVSRISEDLVAAGLIERVA